MTHDCQPVSTASQNNASWRPQPERRAAATAVAPARAETIEAERDALRCDGRDAVDAHPAFVFEPHFGPSVRIGLAHDVVAADRIELAALVTHDDARRQARGTQQHRQRRGVVLAETLARLEQELVDGLCAERRRSQRVLETAASAGTPSRARRSVCRWGCR